MTFNNALKATGRSLKLTATRLAVRIGAWAAPARTAEFVARRFFITEKPSSPRTHFTISDPVRDKLQTPDGEVFIYRWGDIRAHTNRSARARMERMGATDGAVCRALARARSRGSSL